MIIGFAYFYSTIQFNPIEMANNLRKNGGAIPGIRPGKPTTTFISKILSRVTLMGALFLSVVAILLGTTSSAQLKTVAITEVVNKSGDLEYVQRVKIRTHLTAAISKKPGYSAVDRVDIAHILNEQSFQRTGLVDNATIKKLGAITGADYVLMIEAVKTCFM